MRRGRVTERSRRGPQVGTPCTTGQGASNYCMPSASQGAQRPGPLTEVEGGQHTRGQSARGKAGLGSLVGVTVQRSSVAAAATTEKKKDQRNYLSGSSLSRRFKGREEGNMDGGRGGEGGLEERDQNNAGLILAVIEQYSLVEPEIHIYMPRCRVNGLRFLGADPDIWTGCLAW